MNKKMRSVQVPSQSALLHMAVLENNEEAVKFLLKLGADPNSRSTREPLQRLTCEVGHNTSDMREIFYRYRTSSFNACTFAPNPVTLNPCNTTYTLSARSRNFVNPSKLINMGKHRQKNPTPMHIAAANGKRDIIQLLLDHGGDVNVDMEGGFTPLVIAILVKNVEIAKFLIRQGADVNVRGKAGKTPMYFAVKSRQIEMVKLLICYSADVKACTDHGVTPLHVAVERKLLEITGLLLNYGSDPNSKTKTGVTPLHCAAVKGQHDITKMLLHYGGDVSVIMKRGEIDVTPLLWVSESECRKTKEILNEYALSKANNTGFCSKLIKKIWRRFSGNKS